MNAGDQQLGEKCGILQQKLDMLLQTLNNEENQLVNDTEDLDESNLRNEDCPSPGEQEKGVLEKPEKDMTNLKRVRKRKDHREKEAMMAR